MNDENRKKALKLMTERIEASRKRNEISRNSVHPDIIKNKVNAQCFLDDVTTGATAMGTVEKNYINCFSTDDTLTNWNELNDLYGFDIVLNDKKFPNKTEISDIGRTLNMIQNGFNAIQKEVKIGFGYRKEIDKKTGKWTGVILGKFYTDKSKPIVKKEK